jgi:lysophospholipase L1-like esterase
MVVFFAGSNDLAEGDTSSQVLANFKDFVGVVRKELADCRIAFIAITPAPSRWNNLAAMQEANRLVQNWIYTEDNLAFINTYPLFVTKEGGPRPELFLHDQLHLNSEGYGLWRRAVRPYLSWGLEDRGREAW